MLRVLGDTLFSKELAKYIVEDIIRAIIIGSNIAHLIQDTIVLKYRLKVFLLLSSTIASRAV